MNNHLSPEDWKTALNLEQAPDAELMALLERASDENTPKAFETAPTDAPSTTGTATTGMATTGPSKSGPSRAGTSKAGTATRDALLTPITPTGITSMLEEALISRSLSHMLKSARNESGMTLTEVSERMGVSRGRIGQLESEGSNLEAQTLARLADALEYDVVLTLRPRVAGRQVITTELQANRYQR